ncbi:unnamed protein product [Arctogadus glacialis]
MATLKLETTTSNNGARHSICECAESNVQRGYWGQKIQIEDQELFEHWKYLIDAEVRLKEEQKQNHEEEP